MFEHAVIFTNILEHLCKPEFYPLLMLLYMFRYILIQVYREFRRKNLVCFEGITVLVDEDENSKANFSANYSLRSKL